MIWELFFHLFLIDCKEFKYQDIPQKRKNKFLEDMFFKKVCKRWVFLKI